MAKISINIKQGTLTEAETPQKDIIVGIDLGTTNSLVAYIDAESGKSIAVKDEGGSNKLVPSIVHFNTENEGILVGNDAKDYLVTQPENTIYSVKRLMGKSFQDLKAHTDYFGYQVIDDNTESLAKIRVNDKFYTPIELSSLILKQLKHRVEKALNQTVTKAVITVPAYFNDAQRQATRDAGKLAGLEVLRIVNEPTAASLAYGIGLTADEEKTIAVYDFGGGTFDISILSIDAGIFEVLSTNGDTFLGGDDLDRAILDYWIAEHGLDTSALKENKNAMQSLRLQAEKAKVALSSGDVFETGLTLDGALVANPEESGQAERKGGETLVTNEREELKLSLTRSKFEELIQPLVDKTLVSCKRALEDADLKIEAIDEVVLVGGSTRVPLVKEAVGKFFGRTPHDDLNPDEVVALGAAVQADILAGNQKGMLLIDITPLSLGIETMGGLMDVIIPRNSKLPIKAGRQYTTHVDGQGSMRITVYQGERDLVVDNRKLGEFKLTGIPGMPAGMPKVDISFILDADGITRVRAKELRSGVEQSIEVKPSYGLSEEEMSQMLIDSIQNAKSDMQVRALQEALNEANSMIGSVERFVQKNGALLTEAEMEGTKEGVQTLKDVLSSKDKDLIHQHIEALNDFTRPFAERVMDQAIAVAMKGKKI
ncbi:MAG: molecular chaperone DnaK [Chitinophagales bacterium]